MKMELVADERMTMRGARVTIHVTAFSLAVRGFRSDHACERWPNHRERWRECYGRARRTIRNGIGDRIEVPAQ
jgi:hypothetical protein